MLSTWTSAPSVWTSRCHIELDHVGISAVVLVIVVLCNRMCIVVSTVSRSRRSSSWFLVSLLNCDVIIITTTTIKLHSCKKGGGRGFVCYHHHYLSYSYVRNNMEELQFCWSQAHSTPANRQQNKKNTSKSNVSPSNALMYITIVHSSADLPTWSSSM